MNELVSLKSLIWLFLPLFCIHDLEEIISVEAWNKQHANKVQGLLPTRMKKVAATSLSLTSSQFAVAVLIELILFVPFTFLATEKNNYFLFLAFNSIFLLHVFTHLAQSLLLKMYTPGVVSAVLLVLPYSTYLFYRLLTSGTIHWTEVMLSVPVGIILLPVILIGHRIGKTII